MKYSINRDSYKMHKEPILNLPVATKTLCLINLVAFVLTFYIFDMIGGDEYVNLIYSMAVVPERYFDPVFSFADIYSLITHMFLHGGFIHFSINIGMLMALGSAIEQKWGAKYFLIFYFLCGVLGVIPHILLYKHSVAPLIGASGAISGLFAAIIIMIHKRGNHRTLFDKNKGLFIAVTAFIFATIVFGMLGMPGVEEEIAWIVHLGGFIIGLILYNPINKLSIRR